jgi:hypothetical protein
MLFGLAWRSLLTRPLRTAVLAAGFGFGVAVMAELLGVGQVILEQAHSPALNGGGDLMVVGPFGSVSSARFVMSSILADPTLAREVTAASPSRQARLFLMTGRGSVPLRATGGIPSLEKSVGDPEVSKVEAWMDAPGDERWSRPDPGDVLRAMDRFHSIPKVPARASSWAEWLYFNERTRDGRLRLYLTFLVGPPADVPGRRRAGVRLQLERDGRATTYARQGDVDETSVLTSAPDLNIAGNTVRLEGLTYRIRIDLPLEIPGDSSSRDAPRTGSRRDGGARLTGEISLAAAPHRSLPPAEIHGAGGWISGYVVPALAGSMGGRLASAAGSIEFDDAIGYHDHNWGFWEGVSWQWGQVSHEDLSVLYGRIFPPPDVADPDRVPGYATVLGANGPLGFSTNVVIDDTDPARIDVHATGASMDLRLALTASETVRTPFGATGLLGGTPLNFLQLGGTYRVTGTVAGRTIDFTARGSAEAFER